MEVAEGVELEVTEEVEAYLDLKQVEEDSGLEEEDLSVQEVIEMQEMIEIPEMIEIIEGVINIQRIQEETIQMNRIPELNIGVEVVLSEELSVQIEMKNKMKKVGKVEREHVRETEV